MSNDEETSDFGCGYELGFQAGLEQQAVVNTSIVIVMTMVGFCVGLMF